jgi:CRISPR-associated protein Cas2
MSLYLIAYDIADRRRLQRVARHFEKHAQRRQKSVFLADMTESQLQTLLDGAAELMSLSADIVQAWRIAPDQTCDGVGRGAVIPLRPEGVVYGVGVSQFLASPGRHLR